MTLRSMIKHPLFVTVAALALSGGVGVAVATEVGRARDDAQDQRIAKAATDVEHVKLDLDKTAMDVARQGARLDAHEQRHDAEYRELHQRMRDMDACLRSACWRRER